MAATDDGLSAATSVALQVGAGGKQGTKLLLLCPSIASSSDVTPEQQLKMTELGAEVGVPPPATRHPPPATTTATTV